MKLTYRIERLNIFNLPEASWMAAKHFGVEGYTVGVTDVLADTLEAINDGDGAVFVAYDECDVPAGLIAGIWHPDKGTPHYEVRGLWVEPEDRGGPVARMLMRELIFWAGEQDAPVYICTTGEPRGAYRRLGFDPSHVVSVASLAELRRKLGDGNECLGTGTGGCGGAGSDEPGPQRAAERGPV